MNFLQEQYLNPESSSLSLKTIFYQQILKFNAKNLSALDWNSLEANISTDLLSRDFALQEVVLKLFPIIPLKNQMNIITANEEMIKIKENANLIG